MGTVGVSFTSKKAFKKPQTPPPGGAGKVVPAIEHPAPKHDKSYNHNPMHLKKSVMSKLSERNKKSKAYLS